jgi:Cupin domain
VVIAAKRRRWSVSFCEHAGVAAVYSVAHLDEIEELADGRCLYRPVRHRLGITSFGATAWRAHSAGDLIVDEHDEGDPTADEELFVVLQGRAEFELEGDRVDAPAGTFVFAPPGTRRRVFAVEPETTVMLIEGTPGKAYEPRGWELWAPLVPLYETGQYTEVADRLRVAVEAHPQYAMLFYNLACCESLTGRTSDAVDHLRRAIEMSDEFRAAAKSDSDLDAIRDQPAFQRLVRD